jgi:hypothetical protein
MHAVCSMCVLPRRDAPSAPSKFGNSRQETAQSTFTPASGDHAGKAGSGTLSTGEIASMFMESGCGEVGGWVEVHMLVVATYL